jgi:hypothetical protein
VILTEKGGEIAAESVRQRTEYMRFCSASSLCFLKGRMGSGDVVSGPELKPAYR